MRTRETTTSRRTITKRDLEKAVLRITGTVLVAAAAVAFIVTTDLVIFGGVLAGLGITRLANSRQR